MIEFPYLSLTFEKFYFIFRTISIFSSKWKVLFPRQDFGDLNKHNNFIALINVLYLSRVLNELACTMYFSQWEFFLVLTEHFDSLVRISSFVRSLASINCHDILHLAKWPPLAKTLASTGVLGITIIYFFDWIFPHSLRTCRTSWNTCRIMSLLLFYTHKLLLEGLQVKLHAFLTLMDV